MREEQERIKKLLCETVSMLCRNGVTYERELHIEGVIGVTVDDHDVFLVHIDNIIGSSGETTPHVTSEYSQKVKLEHDYNSEYSAVRRLEPVMHGHHSSLMPYDQYLTGPATAGSANNEHISSTIVTESLEIKACPMSEEGDWGDSYEDSYSDLAYPLDSTMSGIDSYQQPRPVQYQSRPRMLVCALSYMCTCHCL